MPAAPSITGGTPIASVVVPATTANVGCAFDCAGIALTLYLRASAVAKNNGFQVVYRGVQADQIPGDESNLIVQAVQRFAARANKDLPGARIDVENEIPLGAGLGSSAAAIVAGTVLGAELCGAHIEAPELLRMALVLEGHPDNIAAAVHGGMVVTATSEGSPDVIVSKTAVSSELDFVAVIPDVPLSTEKARAALPAAYSRQDVVHNLQRTALLTACFFSGQGLSPELFLDRLHQPYRGPLVPGIAECLAFRHDGLAGIFLSGAGSAVMGIARHSAAFIGEALVAEFRRKGLTARALLLKADNRGTQVSNPSGTRILGAALHASDRK